MGRDIPKREHSEEVVSDDSVDDRLVEQKITWGTAAWVINASVIGMGVLTLPKCFVVLGWIVGFCGLGLCLAANVLVAQLMLEIREVYPRAISLADAAHYAFGSQPVKAVIRCILYAEKLACTAVYVNLMATTLGSAFYTVHWCLPYWCLIIFITFLPLMTLKNFSETHVLNVINFATILLVVIFTSVGVVQNSEGLAQTSWLPKRSSSWSEVFGAFAMMVFAFSGNWMYFELMSEMERPHEFIKSFSIAGPTQLALYSVTAFVGYGFMGAVVPGQITEALTFGPLMRIVAFMLTVHIVCGTGTNIVVLIRFFHSRISPKDVNSTLRGPQLMRAALYTGVIGGCIVLTLLVPSYLSLVTFVGALFEAPISFILPMVLYYAVAKKHPSRMTVGRQPLVWVCIGIIALFGSATCVLGVQDALADFAWSGAQALSCNCAGMWNTCDCSPEKMPAGMCSLVNANATTAHKLHVGRKHPWT